MRVFAPAALLVLLAFFSAAELALIRLRPTRVQLLEAEGRPGAASVARLQRRLRRALVATQLGLSLALVALGWSGRGLAERWAQSGAAPGVPQGWLDLGVFVLLVLLATLLGGLLPKAWVALPATETLKILAARAESNSSFKPRLPFQANSVSPLQMLGASVRLAVLLPKLLQAPFLLRQPALAVH